MSAIKIFFTALIIFFVTDMIWLGFIAKSMYFEHYSSWLRLEKNQLNPIWWSAVAVYLLFGLSMVFFVFPLGQGDLLRTAFHGALLGLIIYGVYDFTCLAIFKDFPIKMAFIDVAWGTFLYAWASLVTCFLFNRFLS